MLNLLHNKRNVNENYTDYNFLPISGQKVQKFDNKLIAMGVKQVLQPYGKTVGNTSKIM